MYKVLRHPIPQHQKTTDLPTFRVHTRCSAVASGHSTKKRGALGRRFWVERRRYWSVFRIIRTKTCHPDFEFQIGWDDEWENFQPLHRYSHRLWWWYPANCILNWSSQRGGNNERFVSKFSHNHVSVSLSPWGHMVDAPTTVKRCRELRKNDT